MPREVWLEVRGLSLRTSRVLTHHLLRHRSVTCSADVERIGNAGEAVEKRIDETVERRINEVARDVSMK